MIWIVIAVGIIVVGVVTRRARSAGAERQVGVLNGIGTVAAVYVVLVLGFLGWIWVMTVAEAADVIAGRQPPNTRPVDSTTPRVPSIPPLPPMPTFPDLSIPPRVTFTVPDFQPLPTVEPLPFPNLTNPAGFDRTPPTTPNPPSEE